MSAVLDPNDFTIRQPTGSLAFCKVITIFFIVIFIAAFDAFKDNLTGALSFLPFLLLGPFLIFLWYRWKIVIKGNQITVTPYFGKTKSFTFDYVTKVKCGTFPAKIRDVDYVSAFHDKEKLFTLKNISPDFYILRSRLIKEYKRNE